MRTTRSLKAQVEKTLRRIPDISDPAAALRPVPLNAYVAPDEQAIEPIVARYWNGGFAVVEALEEPSPQRLLELASALHLGEMFIPPLYRSDQHGKGSDGVTTLMAAGGRSGTDRHPAFESAGEQRLHVDGTLQRIGVVQTTILLCKAPASAGGHTILFNALGAFVALLRADSAAALALTVPGCLVRQATYGGCTDLAAGPAFAIRKGLLVTRYSVDTPSRWEVAASVDAQALGRAVAWMEQASRPNSPYYLEFPLEAGQGLVLANDRIAHGRTAYRDGGLNRRCLYRGLFRTRPS